MIKSKISIGGINGQRNLLNLVALSSAHLPRRNASDIKSELPVIVDKKFPTAPAAALKRGTGGRSSFNGTVCTVFGGSGFLATYVINQLGKIGTQIILPYRDDPYQIARRKVAGDLGQIQFFPFYLRDEASIFKCVKYSNVVINLIGKGNETASFTYDEVNVEGCRLLARISKECGVKRFIHVSALNCSPNPKSHIIKGGSKFLKSKYFGELAVREEFPDAIIFRPSDIFGTDDTFLRYYCGAWRRTWQYELPMWNYGRDVFKQPVFCSDVAQGIVNAIYDNDAPGKTYDAVGPRRYELKEIVEYINRIVQADEYFGLKLKNMKYMPTYWIRPTLAEFYRKYPPVTWDRIEREMVNDTPTGNPTLEDLGVKLTYLEEQAWNCIRFLRKHGYYCDELGEFPEPALPKYVS